MRSKLGAPFGWWSRRQLERLTSVWNGRARLDSMYYIKSDREDWTEEEFLRSGETDICEFVDPWLVRLPRAAEESIAVDVGCGLGRLSRALAGRFHQVVGLDIAPEMVERARLFALPVPPNVLFAELPGDGRIPLEDSSVDLVFSYIVFQHVPLKSVVCKYVAEAARILRPGGLLRVQLNTHQRPVRQRLRFRWVKSSRVPVVGFRPRVRLDPHSAMGVVFTERACRRLAPRDRLQMIDIEGIGQQYTWLTWQRLP